MTLGVFNILPRSKCSIALSSDAFMATETNCSHESIPSGEVFTCLGKHPLNSPISLKSVNYSQSDLPSAKMVYWSVAVMDAIPILGLRAYTYFYLCNLVLYFADRRC